MGRSLDSTNTAVRTLYNKGLLRRETVPATGRRYYQPSYRTYEKATKSRCYCYYVDASE
jgi:predicted transcriptional regulator